MGPAAEMDVVDVYDVVALVHDLPLGVARDLREVSGEDAPRLDPLDLAALEDGDLLAAVVDVTERLARDGAEHPFAPTPAERARVARARLPLLATQLRFHARTARARETVNRLRRLAAWELSGGAPRDAVRAALGLGDDGASALPLLLEKLAAHHMRAEEREVATHLAMVSGDPVARLFQPA